MPSKHKSKARKKSRFFSGKVKALIAAVLIIVLLAVAYQMIGKSNPETNSNTTKILLVTNMGNITIELYDDMPITSGNFKNLTKHGIYDGAIFHRVVHNFVIQGGDASEGNQRANNPRRTPQQTQQHQRISSDGEDEHAKLRHKPVLHRP